MYKEKMPGVTLVAFIVAYIDVISRFVNWASGGGLLVPIVSLILVVCANYKQNWARIIWTFLKCVGVFFVVTLTFSGWLNLGLSFISIVLCVVEMIFLWHPKTNEWFDS